MRDRDDVNVRTPSASARVLEWAQVAAVDLEECTHRPADYRQERRRRTFEDPAPCARCGLQDTLSFPQLLDTGPAGLRWLPLCGRCTSAHVAYMGAIVDKMYGIRR